MEASFSGIISVRMPVTGSISAWRYASDIIYNSTSPGVPRSHDSTYSVREPTAGRVDEAQHKEVIWKFRKHGYLLPSAVNQRVYASNERHISISGKTTPRTKICIWHGTFLPADNTVSWT